MSTRYSVEMRKPDGTWESIALFADTVSVTAMEAFITNEFMYGSNACDTIHVIDMETGELMASVEDEDVAEALESGAHIVNDEVVYPPEDWDWEPADIDDDCGFDPYLGCFTDDC